MVKKILLFLAGFFSFSQCALAQSLALSPIEDWDVPSFEQGNAPTTSKLYTLFNTSSNAMSYQITSTQPWVASVAPSAAIPQNGSKIVTLYLVKNQANNLTEGSYETDGSYEAVVTFRQTSPPPPAYLSPITIKVKLTVTAPPTGANVNIQSAPNTPPTLRLRPLEDFALSFFQGAPQGLTKAYYLDNIGAFKANYLISSNRKWAAVSPNRGAINARSTQTLTIGVINAQAVNLPIGPYEATLKFENLTPNTSQRPITIKVRLTVTAPPPVLSVTPVIPPEDLVASAVQGSMPYPAQKIYTLMNTGLVSLDYEITRETSTNTNLGVVAAFMPGMINAGQFITVPVTLLNPAAKNLDPGYHEIAVRFKNNSNTAQADIIRKVQLTITPAPAPILSVDPLCSFEFSGNIGGPFEPSSQECTLANTGNAPMDWSVNATPSWLVIEDPSSGQQLAAETSQEITVSLNASAVPLPSGVSLGQSGIQTGSISFINDTNGTTTTRPVTVTVFNNQAGPLKVETVATSKFFGNQGGGPVLPANISYSLKNEGNIAMELHASSNNKPWISFSPQDVTIQPGVPATMNVSVNAAYLPASTGSHKATITFDNTSNNLNDTTTRSVELMLSLGHVFAWGNDAYNNFGTGTDGQNPAPVLDANSAGLNGVVKVVAGFYHTLALKNDGTVWAWGDNTYKQLGDELLDRSPVPIKIEGLENVKDIAAGYYHNIALLSDGTVRTWGYNNTAQLCATNSIPRSTAEEVQNLTDVVAVSAGSNHSLFLKSDGSAYYCGQSLAVGLAIALNPVPTAISLTGAPANSKVIAITAGDHQTLLLLSTRDVWYGGKNYSTEDISNDSKAELVSGLSNISAISAGEKHLLVLLSDDTVKAWGKNDFGQLGDGTTDDNFSPAPVVDLSQAKILAAGGNRSFSITASGIKAWGENNSGELGTGDTNPQSTPALVDFSGGPCVWISSSPDHTVALE